LLRFYKDLNARSAYHQSRVSLSSSIAFADDAWAFGKPIYDSFALVNAHKSLENKVITLGRVENDYRADNRDFKTILLNDLSSYDNINIPVDIDDLAPGYDIGSGMLSFYPKYKTGHKAIIGTAAKRFALYCMFKSKIVLFNSLLSKPARKFKAPTKR